jgi:hypothetical protein
VRWEGFEAPETTPIDEVHYLMQPYHALELALANEQRAERFFARLARAATTASVRKAARELQQEEREHVELVRAWMKKVPKPDADWANDPDPPSYTIRRTRPCRYCFPKAGHRRSAMRTGLPSPPVASSSSRVVGWDSARFHSPKCRSSSRR